MTTIRRKQLCETCEFYRPSSFDLNGYCIKWGRDEMTNIETPKNCIRVLEQMVLSNENVKKTNM